MNTNTKQETLKELESTIEYAIKSNGVDRGGLVHIPIRELRSAVQIIREQQDLLVEARRVLEVLVTLKDMKESEGKTESYENWKPLAWKQAREILDKLNAAIGRE